MRDHEDARPDAVSHARRLVFAGSGVAARRLERRPRRRVRRCGRGAAAVRLDGPQHPARARRRRDESTGIGIGRSKRCCSGEAKRSIGPGCSCCWPANKAWTSCCWAFASEDGKDVKPWLPALVSDGELYLFDCRLGLPIPGPDGKGVATLRQVVADDAVAAPARSRRRTSVSRDRRRPAARGGAGRGFAAQPCRGGWRWSNRAWRASTRWSLTSPGDALAERVKKLPHVSDVRLWRHPFDIWRDAVHARPPRICKTQPARWRCSRPCRRS